MIVFSGRAAVPVRRHTKAGFNGLCAGLHFIAQVQDIGFTLNSVDLATHTDDGRNVVGAVVFHIEQIQMGLDDGNAFRICLR